MFFIINYFFSSPENVKKALQSILYLRKDPRFAFDSCPLNIVNTKCSHDFDLDQDPFSESCDDRLQTEDPQETEIDSTPSVHLTSSSRIPMVSGSTMTKICQR